MKHLLLLFMFFFSVQIYAATQPSGSGGGWTNTTIKRVSLDDVIEATAKKQVTKNGTAYTLESIAQETINRNSIGKVALKRLVGGSALVLATQSLLDGIGWIMEDGVYVKKVDPDSNIPANEDPTIPYIFATGGGQESDYIYSSAEAAGRAMCAFYNESYNSIYWWSNSTNHAQSDVSYVWCVKKDGARDNWDVRGKPNPIYNPNATPSPDLKPKIVPLTAALLGAAMVGSQYLDPDPNFDNTRVNTDHWTDVENSYKEDPKGLGNDLNDRLQDKFDNAPETPTKPTTSPKPDGDAQKYPDKETKPGGEGETDKEKHPVTGEETGKGTFTLPDWCLWAADNCNWHKEDKQHQKDESEVWDKEQMHRDSQLTFWEKVTDFFTWAKDESDTNNEEPQEPDTTVLDREFDTKFEVNAQCPPNPKIEFPIVGSVELGFNKICDFFSFLKFGVLTASSMLACWIVSSAVRGGE